MSCRAIRCLTVRSSTGTRRALALGTILLAMKRTTGAVAAFAIAGIIASTAAGAAIAEPEAEHIVGDQCIGADIGRRDVAPTGQAIICDSNYHWEPYVGQTPTHSWGS